MIPLENIELFLPKQLSAESTRTLIRELSQFPNNIDKRMYSFAKTDSNYLYQGDGLKSALVVNIPDFQPIDAPVIVLSNSCDINLENPRLFPSNVVYATIFNLDKYTKVLLEEGIENDNSIQSHIDSIRRQEITQIFYLPKGGQLCNESIVFFDRVNNCPIELMRKIPVCENRIFTLSNYGFYLFLFKLSIHMTRMTEGFDRKSEGFSN